MSAYRTYARESEYVSSGNELALITPLSGRFVSTHHGSKREWTELRQDLRHERDAAAYLSHPRAGATSVLAGTTWQFAGKREAERLEYECHGERAHAEMRWRVRNARSGGPGRTVAKRVKFVSSTTGPSTRRPSTCSSRMTSVSKKALRRRKGAS